MAQKSATIARPQGIQQWQHAMRQRLQRRYNDDQREALYLEDLSNSGLKRYSQDDIMAVSTNDCLQIIELAYGYAQKSVSIAWGAEAGFTNMVEAVRQRYPDFEHRTEYDAGTVKALVLSKATRHTSVRRRLHVTIN